MSDTTKNNVASFPATWEEYDTNNCGSKSAGGEIVTVKAVNELSTEGEAPIEYDAAIHDIDNIFTESTQNIISMIKSGKTVICPYHVYHSSEDEGEPYNTYGTGIFNYYNGEHEWKLELQSGDSTIIIVQQAAEG